MDNNTVEVIGRSLKELAPAFEDVSVNAPYLYAEVQITVKLYLDHPDLGDSDGVSSDCGVHLEIPGPSRLAFDEDAFLVGDMEQNTTSFIIDGKETVTPLSLQDIIKAFDLDENVPIWHLGYE